MCGCYYNLGSIVLPLTIFSSSAAVGSGWILCADAVLIRVELPVPGNGGRSREGECLYDRILRGTDGRNGPEGKLGGQMASGGQLPARMLRHHRHGTV